MGDEILQQKILMLIFCISSTEKTHLINST